MREILIRLKYIFYFELRKSLKHLWFCEEIAWVNILCMNILEFWIRMLWYLNNRKLCCQKVKNCIIERQKLTLTCMYNMLKIKWIWNTFFYEIVWFFISDEFLCVNILNVSTHVIKLWFMILKENSSFIVLFFFDFSCVFVIHLIQLWLRDMLNWFLDVSRIDCLVTIETCLLTVVFLMMWWKLASNFSTCFWKSEYFKLRKFLKHL